MNDLATTALSDPKQASLVERTGQASRRVTLGLMALVLCFLLVWGLGLLPHAASHSQEAAHGEASQEVQAPAAGEGYSPPLWAVVPFALLLLSIAVLPLLGFTQAWWHHNKNRFLVAATLGIVTLFFYTWGHPGGLDNHFTHHQSSPAGLSTMWTAFSNGIFVEFIPFIVLLFSLYVISGGIHLAGDLPARPSTNAGFLGLGTLLASFIGTTGAAMVLIRPLIVTNIERRYKVHTIVFFIFMVCNCGGLLLPIGDPPLFLGYLRGVPFTWTLRLWPYWVAVNAALLAVYLIWDSIVYRKESLRDLIRDERQTRPLKLYGHQNLLFLLGIVLCVAFIVPDKSFVGSSFHPPQFFREAVMLLIVAVSLRWTDLHIRVSNRFDYIAITEVAALFSGIFITMQVPIEILNQKGPSLGVDTALEFFWATGILSSFLDNAPTYVVFFEAATTLPVAAGAAVVTLSEARTILEEFLIPISLGAVFMGANTYIGNGPNFMVKSIAEQAGIRMPSFFGYMGYSVLILGPILIGLSFFI